MDATDAIRAHLAHRSDPLPPREMWQALRVAAEMSRSQLAASLGVTRQSIWYWETGRRSPRGQQRRDYAEALRVLREAS